jgi:DNA invertase Pin-like site-specific DNA recombinase
VGNLRAWVLGVELRGRFSNPKVRAIVAQATQAVTVDRVDSGDEASPPLAGQTWRLIDRLGEQIIRDLLRDRRTGTTHCALAERYGISLSSVKRVLRRHRGYPTGHHGSPQ